VDSFGLRDFGTNYSVRRPVSVFEFILYEIENNQAFDAQASLDCLTPGEDL
jgi:hypothetical protein